MPRKILAALAIGALGFMTLPSLPGPALAICTGCPGPDVTAAENRIEDHHREYEDLLMREVSTEFETVRSFFTSGLFQGHILPALMLFTEQMSAVAMYQVMIFGTFLDAKQQLETQRIFQQLEVQAHKDYHPSEDFCWFGTNVRSLASSEQLGKVNAVALNATQLARELGNVNMASAETPDADKAARWRKFIENYCDPSDNNRTETAGTGLQLACQNPPANSRRINIDIDYTRAIDEPRTLNVNFTNGFGAPVTATSLPVITADEQDVIALASNLYANTVPSRNAFSGDLEAPAAQSLYMALRSVAAKRSVARNSFNAIVGLKTAGSQSGVAPVTPPGGTPQTPPNTNRFLGAILTELGVPADEVYTIIGNDPSYYAQLELLAKKIYQNPDFYANLYDKPANIARKSVALKAIELMLDRAIFESQLRQEMATSVLLSSRLRGAFQEVEKNLPAVGGQ